MKLYIIEFYTKSGEIRFAWVGATTQWGALDRLKTHRSYYTLICVEEASNIVPLGTKTPPLFIDCKA